MRIGVSDFVSARVARIESGPVNVHATLTLPGGDTLHAVVTRDSATRMALAPGVPVTALLLPPGVLLSTGGGVPAAETRWWSTVEAMEPGALNLRVRLRTGRGTTVHAVLTQAAADELGLAVGVAVDVGILASHVVLAVPGEPGTSFSPFADASGAAPSAHAR